MLSRVSLGGKYGLGLVARVSKPAVSPISQSAGRQNGPNRSIQPPAIKNRKSKLKNRKFVPTRLSSVALAEEDTPIRTHLYPPAPTCTHITHLFFSPQNPRRSKKSRFPFLWSCSKTDHAKKPVNPHLPA